jgi:plastocyanin domain-containing protein
MNKIAIIGSVASLGLVFGIASNKAVAQMSHEQMQPSQTKQTSQFHRIEQPLWAKAAVTAGGLGLIGLELWWFLLSKPKSQKAQSKQGIQEVTITVDGGYEPSQVVVNAGQRVRLNFYRKDSSSCLEEIRFPDFHIAQELPLNQVTPIEFTPNEPGTYTFTCGMNMFRGEVKVEAGQVQSPKEDEIMADIQPIMTTPANQNKNGTDAVHAIVEQGVQRITVQVDKGYTPNHIVVKAGQRVQLNFLRQDPSGCLAQVLIPDFGIAADLPLNETTTIEFTPEKAGEYAFTCGMNMFRGVIEVEPSNALRTQQFSTQISA